MYTGLRGENHPNGPGLSISSDFIMNSFKFFTQWEFREFLALIKLNGIFR